MTGVVAVVQARLGSRRFPGKVLRPLEGADPATAGLTVLDWVLSRLQAATTIDTLVVATSTDPGDDPLADHVTARGHRIHRGDLHDVLARFRDAALAHAADTVVRITADCPLVDPGVVDRVVEAHLAAGDDFTANRLPPPHRRSYPIGLDVEVATIGALCRAGDEATGRADREHVMPYLYAVPGRFRTSVVESDHGDHGAVRWTVDTPADLSALSGLVARPDVRLHSPWSDLLREWYADPSLARLNAAVVQKTATDVDDRS